ncbi:MAG: Gfo/Idh/MocA family oxidoreductase [Verrucomicrobiae bacterium]|nr:Gfo/Idh/MocA family oxidoreductase [Verrucomicrobiae bacterium]
MTHLSRRQFLKSTLVVAAGASRPLWAQQAPAALPPGSPNAKLGTACIAVGGRGAGHIGPAASERLGAICDVDRRALDKVLKDHPGVKAYTDYRKMFDEMSNQIDAVFVATPDHHHAPASMLALQAGKACYTEKPLTWSIQEARKLAEVTAAKKVATQMGNQGHANKGNRLIVEWIRDGALGEIKEVHTWTNRPIWPQGNLSRGQKAPVPETLDFDCWLGPAPKVDYTVVSMTPRPRKKKGKGGKEEIEQPAPEIKSPFVGFNWRGWFDYGCGAIGDMGCHSWDNVFWSLAPDYPEYVELLEIVEPGRETFAKQTKFKWVFPAKGQRAGFTAFWYSGGLKPPVPEEILNDPVYKGKPPALPGSGTIYIGTKGKMLVSGDYGDSPRLIPESAMKDFMESRQGKTSPNFIEPSPGHHAEFLMAARGEKPWNFPKSNFAEYAGPLTEVMLLGVLAEKIGKVGFKIECDPVKRIVKTKEAAALLGRRYRKGWSI